MGSIRTVENIATLAKTSVTTLSLPASRLNIGASQYVTSVLALDTATIGVGGVDVTIAASSSYTVYAVVSSGVVYLIASLNASLPAGFTQARVVGKFDTNGLSQINIASGIIVSYFGQPGMPGEHKVVVATYTNSSDVYVDTIGATLTLESGGWELGYDAELEMYNSTGSAADYNGDIIIANSGNTEIPNSKSVVRVYQLGASGKWVYVHATRRVFLTLTSTTTYKLRSIGGGVNLLCSPTVHTTFWAKRLTPQ